MKTSETFPLPSGDHKVRVWRAWSYERVTQTATSVNRREEINAKGEIVNSWLIEPTQLHCVFPTEFEHLAAAAGFVEAVYGDFQKSKLADDSHDMIFVSKALTSPY
ncbi:MAG: hypothetical protein WEA61_09515 [Anaerolineales bacterium]